MSKPLKPWKSLAKEDVLQTPWFSISKHAMRTAEGADATYYMHHTDDSVVCFCVTDDDKILIERQYRPPIGRVSVDFPAGKMEPHDDNPAAAVLRELREETGFETTSLELLATIDNNPGFSTTRSHLFLARGSITGTPEPEATESIQLAFVNRQQLLAMIHKGELCCAFCISTTFFALGKLDWPRV